MEKALVAAWWLAALAVCAYAFMLGMGGEPQLMRRPGPAPLFIW
jgi:hypothetical protein